MVLCLRTACVLLWLCASSAACRDDACTAACKRVSQCKEDKHKSSEQVLGERAPPPDRRCMDRCKNQPEAWRGCEAKGHSCSQLRACLGANFDD